MTDKISGFFVTLDKDIREDDFEALKNAVLMFRHVLSVDSHVAKAEQHIAEERARADIATKLLTMLYGKSNT